MIYREHIYNIFFQYRVRFVLWKWFAILHSLEKKICVFLTDWFLSAHASTFCLWICLYKIWRFYGEKVWHFVHIYSTYIAYTGLHIKSFYLRTKIYLCANGAKAQNHFNNFCCLGCGQINQTYLQTKLQTPYDHGDYKQLFLLNYCKIYFKPASLRCK